MKWLGLVVLCACASKSVPDDHQLHRTDADGRVKIVGKAVPLATLVPGPLPMTGDVDVDVDVLHLDDAPDKASGKVRIVCTHCRIGDDKARLKIDSKHATGFAGDGIDFGHLDFDRVTFAADIAEGKATITTFEVASNDVTFKLAGSVALAKPLEASRVDLCLRFAATPALRQRDAKMDALLATTGAPMASDGLFNIKLTDRYATMKRLGVICDGTTPPVDVTAGSDVPPPPTNNDVDPEVAKQIAAMVKKVSDTSYEIDRATWQKLLASPLTFGRGARVVPAVKDGKPNGFKLYAIKPESVFAKLGFINGDTLVSIRGQALGAADQALEMYAKLREVKVGEKVDVVVDRRGAPVTLSYVLR